LRTRPAAGVGAAAHPAYREVGWRSKEDNVAYINACRLERRPEIQDRIGYLTRQEERLIAEKRQRIEQRLWAIHEANIQDLFEIYEQPKTTKDREIETDQNGQRRVERKERPRLVSELSPDIAKLIEDVTPVGHRKGLLADIAANQQQLALDGGLRREGAVAGLCTNDRQKN
jgi:hypothetical protein